MGIRGLWPFLNQTFRRWKRVDDQEWNNLIIDGSTVYLELYRLGEWDVIHGGEYTKYSRAIEDFFRKVKHCFKKHIVVLDGGSFGFGSRKAKHMHVAEGTVKVVGSMPEVTDANNSRMLASVFLDVLRSLGVEIYVTEGEADQVIAGLANEHHCPVLASDSDFFIFKLEYGFISFKEYHEKEKEARIFCVSEFMRQFYLKQHKQCLLIPVRFGNDFIQPTYTSRLKGFEPRDFELFISEIARFDSYEFLDQCDDRKVWYEKFEQAEKFYCTLRLPEEDQAVARSKVSELPEWIFRRHQAGCFLTYLPKVCNVKFNRLPEVVEVVTMVSAWRISRYIRQFMYGFMGLSEDVKIKEKTRKDYLRICTDEPVSPKIFKGHPVTVNDDLFTSAERKDVEKLQDLVLTVLKHGQKLSEKFRHLHSKWKLPIAATFYWYRKIIEFESMLEQPLRMPQSLRRDLLKSLLLSFLTCSGDIQNDVPPLPPVTRSSKSDHLTALHAFAQWQCVYYDARALNYLAREPFPTTSFSSLYSGQVALHYATSVCHSGDWLADVVARGSQEWELLNTFLYIVTGCDEDGKEGRHAVDPAPGWSVKKKSPH